MSVNLKNAEAEALLNALAEATGETLTAAATQAFRERLERIRQANEARGRRQLTSVLDLIAEARREPPPRDGASLKQLTDTLWGDGE